MSRSSSTPDGEPAGPSRGQLVLATAAVVALALAPVALAYLQLGYHPDADVDVEGQSADRDAVRALELSVYEASADVPGDYAWDDREAAVEAVRERLAPRLETIRTARVEEGVAYQVSYNGSEAAAWAAENCPGGPDRQFGPCEAHDGVVIQERDGATHVLGVAADLTVTTDRGSLRSTVRVRTLEGA